MGYDIFLSYEHRDQHIAKELEQKFRANGLHCCLAEESIDAGGEWVRSLRGLIKESDKVLILVTPRSINSRWIYLEAGAAWMENRTIIPLLQFVDPGDLPEIIKLSQAKRIETEAEKLDLIHHMTKDQNKDSRIEVSLDFILDHIKLCKYKMDQDRFQPNLIIGSGRGGAICASMFASYSGLHALKVVGLQFIGSERRIDESSLVKRDLVDKNVLVVEWVRQTGKTFALIRDKVLAAKPAALKSYALFRLEDSQEAPDYCGVAVTSVPDNRWSIY